MRWFFLISGIILSAGSFVLVYADTDFSFRWVALGVYLLSIVFVFLSFFGSKLGKEIRKRVKFDWVDAKYLIVIMTLSTALSFTMLKNYPFVGAGDELRDGGLNAMEIAEGKTKNIFGYGKYDAHGLIIPSITSFFYLIFGSSVLTYRVPAAIMGILCVFLVYLAARFAISKTAGFWAAFILATLPLHLFYSRTEVVVISSSLLSLVIILLFFVFIKNRTMWSYVLLATGLGVAMNFHASIKATALIVVLLTAVIFLYDLVLARGRGWQKIFIFLIFFLIGFGPRLLFTPINIFFHTSRFGLKDSGSMFMLGERYVKSIFVWGSEPTSAWYPDHKPIFSILLFYFFVLGIAVSLIKKNVYLISLFAIVLVSHLTNSAITDMVNGDHRLSPLFPIGAIFAGAGVDGYLRLVGRAWRNAVSVILIGCVMMSTVIFFVYQKATLNRTMLDYISMNTVYILKNSVKAGITPICFLTSLENAKNFVYPHYKEQYKFLLPEYLIDVKGDSKITDNQIYVLNGNCQNMFFDKKFKNYVIRCKKRSLNCPAGYEGEIVIRSQI